MAKTDSFESDTSRPDPSSTESSLALSLEGNPSPRPTSDSKATPGADRGQPANAGVNQEHQHHNNFHVVTPETPGLDVSEFNGTINWPKVAKSGAKFAFIRATEGTTIQDATFQQNWKGAIAAGLKVGAYHFFTTTSPVQDQITNFTKTVAQGRAGSLPPVIDVEAPAQFAKFTVAQRVQMIQQMLDGVQNATGQQPILYMSSDFNTQELGSTSQFDKYKLWVADYTSDSQPDLPKTFTKWSFWQHSDSGTISGVIGNVDLDYFDGTASQLPKTQPAAPTKQPNKPK